MKKYIFIFCFVLVINLLKAQETKTHAIVGSFKSEVPMFILLKNTIDSTLLRATVCDSASYFCFDNLLAGDYYVEVSSDKKTGHLLKNNILITNNSESIVDIGEYNRIDVFIQNLPGVVIESPKRQVYEQELGKFTFNVKHSDFAKGNKAMDALRITPMVTIGLDDDIQVLGQSPTIYFNGRKSNLNKTSLVQYLKALPAGQVAKIEVITMPSAKYEAAGSGGIINIVFTRSSQMGLQGNVELNYTQLHYANYSPSINLEFNSKKWRLFANGGYNQNRNYREVAHHIVYNTSSGPQIWDKYYWARQKLNGSYFIQTGAEFFYNDNHTFYISLTGNYGKQDLFGLDTTKVYQPGNVLTDSILKTVNEDNNKNKDYAIDFYHTYKDEKRNIEWESGIGYFNSNSDGQQLLNSTTTDINNEFIGELGYMQQRTNSFRGFNAQSDLLMSILNNSKLKTGLKYSYTDARFPLQWYDGVNGSLIENEQRSDNYKIIEHIAAAYTELMLKIHERIKIQVGLRGEYTNNQVNNVVLDNLIQKSYFQVFPTLLAQYLISNNHIIAGGVTRRIGRPNYGFLNPGKRYENPYKYSIGNPYLNAGSSINSQLMYTFKQRYSCVIFYTNGKNTIYNIPITDPVKQTVYLMPQNVGREQSISIQLNFPIGLLKNRWILSNSIRYSGSEATVPDIEYKAPWKFYWSIQHNETFKITKNGKSRIGLDFNYVSSHLYGVQTVGSMATLDINISRDFFKDRCTVKVIGKNLLDTHNQTMERMDESGSYYQKLYSNDRGFTVSLSWNFHTGFKRKTKNKQSLTEDQKGRTQL